MARRTLLDRCKSTLKSQRTRARKYGAEIDYTAEQLLALVSLCRYCGDRITVSQLNFDHRIPVSRGGSWSLDNLAALCARCNRRKGALTEAEYHALLVKLDELGPLVKAAVLKRMAAGAAFIHS